MAIITISRGTFSGGKMLAERLSRALNYPCIDRDALVRKAATIRVSEFDLRAALEQPPEYPAAFNHKRRLYLALIQAALAEQVRGGSAVYHGMAGHLLLKDAPGLVRVRIIAPIEFRVAEARQRLNLGESEAADYIRRLDRDRRRWTQFLYGVDWADPSLYDLVINLERMSVAQACAVVARAVEEGDFQSSREETLDDIALASRVRAELAQSVFTLHLEVTVRSRQGIVTVAGDAASEDAGAIERVARAVPGVMVVTVAPPNASPSKPRNPQDRP